MNRIRLYIVDDHPAICAGVIRIVSAVPEIEVVGTAGDGVTAVQQIADLLPDVVLLDICLPRMNGIAVARELRTQAPQTKILAFSGYEDPAYVQGIIECGAAGYLVKHEALERVVEAIRSVAAGETGWLSRSVASIVMQLQQSSTAHSQRKAEPSLLTPREREVLALLSHGLDNAQIAERLQVNKGTIKNHVLSITSKLGVHSRAEAVAWAWRTGLNDSS